ncbi:MAG: NAD-dependent epimerase/dehydratase family protein [Pseudomonadota bacterium]|nr:NAD-dependent epimerase/dehydratase family protein [Pseudomonadota bacterium]
MAADSNRGRVLIAGCGDLGNRLGTRLVRAGFEVWGLRRSSARIADGITPVGADLGSPRQLIDNLPECIEYLVFAAAADRFDAAAYQSLYVQGSEHLLAACAERGIVPHWAGFVSSTSVYGQRDGEWVDETSATAPEGFSGRALLQAESVWEQAPFATTRVRFAGLYGPGRTRLIERVRSGQRTPPEPPKYSNRIHIDDAARLLQHLVQAVAGGVALDDLYIGVDDTPAPLHEVEAHLAALLGAQGPVKMQADASRVGSKRCTNQRIRNLGFAPLYPSYREGYAALLASGGQSAPSE